MAPAAWNREAKVGALVWLWLEPTFRERVLEIRTDTPILLILVACTLLWNRRRTVNGLLAIVAMVVLGILISPKLLFFGLPWSIGAICSTPNGQRNEMFRLMSLKNIADQTVHFTRGLSLTKQHYRGCSLFTTGQLAAVMILGSLLRLLILVLVSIFH